MTNRDTENRHIQHSHYHMRLTYPKSWIQQLYSAIFIPLVVFVATFLILFFAVGTSRMSLLLALVVSIPLSLLITRNRTMEKIFLPVFDIIQSIPVLAFFPVVILVFVRSHFLNGAAIFIFFLSMLWIVWQKLLQYSEKFKFQ